MMQKIGRPGQMLSIPSQKLQELQRKQKAYNEPRYEKPTDINAINHSSTNNHKGSFSRYQGTYKKKQSNNYNGRNNSQNNVPRQSNNKESVC